MDFLPSCNVTPLILVLGSLATLFSFVCYMAHGTPPSSSVVLYYPLLVSAKEQTKNHQGGIAYKPSDERQTCLYSTGQLGDEFSCIQLCMSKLNPSQETFFQKANPKYQQSDAIWYQDKPLGVNWLTKIMKEICCPGEPAFPKHTQTTVYGQWSDSCIPAYHTTNISDHTNKV